MNPAGYVRLFWSGFPSKLGKLDRKTVRACQASAVAPLAHLFNNGGKQPTFDTRPVNCRILPVREKRGDGLLGCGPDTLACLVKNQTTRLPL